MLLRINVIILLIISFCFSVKLFCCNIILLKTSFNKLIPHLKKIKLDISLVPFISSSPRDTIDFFIEKVKSNLIINSK